MPRTCSNVEEPNDREIHFCGRTPSHTGLHECGYGDCGHRWGLTEAIHAEIINDERIVMTQLTITAQIITTGEGDATGVMVRSDAEELDSVVAEHIAAQALRLWEEEHAVTRYSIRDLVWKEETESSSAIFDLDLRLS